jgi:hypothetical protein
MADHIGERLDQLLAELPDDAWTITHDVQADYRVCTITIDWRKVPGPEHTHWHEGTGDGYCIVCGHLPLRLAEETAGDA